MRLEVLADRSEDLSLRADIDARRDSLSVRRICRGQLIPMPEGSRCLF
jgi:hypothetical protein